MVASESSLKHIGNTSAFKLAVAGTPEVKADGELSSTALQLKGV
jgi:hypothetical protein